MAPGARIVSVKVAGHDGVTSVGQVVAAIDWVVEHHDTDGLNIRAYTHPLGDSGVTFFADAATARRLRRRFPRSLGDTKLLLPTSNTVLRRSIDTWLEQHELVADVAAEFEDSALLKAFGRLGKSVFPGPTAIESDITEQYHVSVVGRTDDIREAFYAISPERRLKNPAAAAITESWNNTARATELGTSKWHRW